MSLSGAPKPLLGLRIAQLIIALPIMAATAFANAHPSYWTNLKGATALVEITGGITLIATGFWIFSHLKGFCPNKPWKAIILDIIVLILWVASISQLLGHRDIDEDQKFNFDHSVGLGVPDAPKSSWYASAAMALIEAVMWVGLAALMWRQAGLGK